MEFYRILLKKESTGTTRTTAQISIMAIMWPLFQLKYLEFTMFSTEKQLGIFLMCRLLTFFTILQFFGGISRHTLAEIHHTEKTFDISGYGDWQQSYHRMCPPSYRTTAAAYNSDCAIPASAGLCRPKMVWEGTLSQILSKEDHLGLIYLHFGGWHFANHISGTCKFSINRSPPLSRW